MEIQGLLLFYWFVGLYWRLGGESFVTPPTGKSCFVFVFAFALRASVKRREIKVLSRHVFVLLLQGAQETDETSFLAIVCIRFGSTCFELTSRLCGSCSTCSVSHSDPNGKGRCQ